MTHPTPLHDPDHPAGGGLALDLATMARQAERRRLLRLLGTGSALALSGAAQAAVCSRTPVETNGPYPADGSNGSAGSPINALILDGIVRQDIRTSVAGASGTAPGLPMQLKVKLVDVNGSCASLAGYAIYVWHCTRDGLYSLYSAGVTGENFLRGVQATDANGVATFTTIFPGCYAGRMPHIHFEVYRSLGTATAGSNALLVSQMAFPVDTCTQVYGSVSGYSASLSNFQRISFETDNVFSDGYATQLLTMRGNTTRGMVAGLKVGIAA